MTADGDATVERRLIANRYALIAKLGEGGFGAVYLARDTLLMRDVALKLLGSMSADRRERFFREARATARLKHPNIVSIYDAGEDESGLYLVLEVVPGRSLAELIPMDRDRATTVIREVAEALAAAHEAGIVHRDIKPANILIDERGRAKVADFGIARIQGEAQVTVTGHVVGTPNYMAPEQLDGKAAGPEADLYALGVVMSEIGLRDHAITKRLLDPDPKKRGTARQVVEELGVRRRLMPRWLPFVALVVLVIATVAIFAIRRPPGQPRMQHVTIRLKHAKANDIAKFKDDFEAIPFTALPIGSSDVQIEAPPGSLAAAKDAVGIIDSLAGYQFKSEPNLFTGSKPSTRHISTASSKISSVNFIALVAHAADWPLVQDQSIKIVGAKEIPVALRNVPWDEAVQNIIDRLDLVLWRDGDVWILESRQSRQQHERTAELFCTAFEVTRADRLAMAESLRRLLGESGAIAVSPRGMIVVFDSLERVQAIRTALQDMDRNTKSAGAFAIFNRRFTGEPMSFNLRDADVVQLIQTFSRFTGLSAVIDPSVRGSVSVNLNDVPWDNAFDAILRSQGLAYNVPAHVINVTPESKAYDGPPVEKSIHLERVKPTFFLAFAKSLSADHAEIVLADDNSGTLILRGDERSVVPAVWAFQTIDKMH
jgi:serine/threonine protein kinase